MSREFVVGLFVAVFVLLFFAAIVVDRFMHRWLTGRTGIALAVEDATPDERATEVSDEHVLDGEEQAVAEFREQLVDAAQFDEPAPTLRELSMPTWLVGIRHDCEPECPDRPTDYTGPIILGKRCRTCLGPTHGTDICDACWDAEDRAFTRRSDR